MVQMKKQVRIAEFKANLSRYLRAAQKGAEVVIKDRDTPIARLGPYQEPRARPEWLAHVPRGSLKDVDKLPFYTPKGVTLKDLEDIHRDDRREYLDKFSDDGLR